MDALLAAYVTLFLSPLCVCLLGLYLQQMSKVKELRDEAEAKKEKVAQLNSEMKSAAAQFTEAVGAARSWYEQAVDETERQHIARHELEMKRIHGHVDRALALSEEIERMSHTGVLGALLKKSQTSALQPTPPSRRG